MAILKVLKPKTRPIQVEPWFIRYLNGGELKVLSAILAHADSTRANGAFPSNATIAFYSGLKKNSVKNIKRRLIDKGVIQRELVGKPGRQVAVLTIDLDWSKDRYLKEFDQEFNSQRIIPQNIEDLNSEITKLKELIANGELSDSELVIKLEELREKIKQKEELEKKEDDEDLIPEEDQEKVVEEILKVKRSKAAAGKTSEVINVEAYRKKIFSLIKRGQFKNAQKFYKQVVEGEIEEIKSHLYKLCKDRYDRYDKDGKSYYFTGNIVFKDGRFFAEYSNYDDVGEKKLLLVLIKKDTIVSVVNIDDYTVKVKDIFKNYDYQNLATKESKNKDPADTS